MRSVSNGVRRYIVVLSLVVVGASCGSQRAIAEPLDVRDSIVRLAGTACLKPILVTAFVVASGTIVTVAHGIAGVGDDLRVIDSLGGVHDVDVMAFDDQLDIAVISVDGFEGIPIDAAQAVPGTSGVVAAMTADSDIALIDYEVLRNVNARTADIYNDGTVERAAVDVRSDVQRGTSGAPLLNDKGEYIAMLFAISSDRESGVYALAASEIVDYLSTATMGTHVDRGRCR